MVDAKGLDVQVTVGWWERVRARHPNLTLRNGESLSQARMKAIDQVVLDTYFNLLHHILVSNNLLNKPAHLFNSDETGFPLCHKTGNIIIDKKQKHPYRAASPMVIYDRKGLNPDWLIGEVPGTSYGL